jgi:putative transposase
MNKKFQKRKKFEGRAKAHLLQQNFKIENPNEVWISDISYIKTTQGFVYLAVVFDLGWAIEDHMRVD